MLTSTQTDTLGRRFGDEQTIRILSAAGFDAYDFSTFRLVEDPDYPLNQPDYREHAAHLRTVADRCGILCNQAHAPFPTSTDDPVETADIFEKVVRSMEIASILGAKIIIVHPRQHLRYLGNEKTLRDMNLDFYRTLIPYAQKFNIRIAVENMWQWEGGRINHSTCSRPEEFCDYLDSIHSEWVVGCLDIGHVSLVEGGDLSTMIHALGQTRLQALHVHDTDFSRDLHTLPFVSKISFSDVTRALSEIGYQGDLTLEADNFLRNVPDALIPAAVGYMSQVARYLAQQITN